ncbi:hypothetical protein [Streptomyces abikoensis]|uniref:hypothetical protein n=1 Tax=Streptomyces abikoensis TaxID=97398 RepID=UPI001675FA3D|nr:hypothetical protein [Streptomyces abikoensis]GGP55744.1 hypothetical protein GCM10010214_31170 [Streptomyces abikoensis]
MPSDDAPLCACGHRRSDHNTPWATGREQCRRCDRGWRHIYTPNAQAGADICSSASCPAADALSHLHRVLAELYERSGSCARTCSARHLADRVLTVLDTPGD